MPTCRYHYDALDRLAARTDFAQDTTRHFYQASRLATAIGNHLQRTILATDRQLLAQKDVSKAGERSHLLATDQQDSVLRAASVGQRIDIAYSPYGHRQDPGPLPGFTGQDADPLTGHYLLGNGYRAFNPVLKRFNSPDSVSPFGEGGLNAYAYCHGDPVNRQDPTGHDDEIFPIVSLVWSVFAFYRAGTAFKDAWPKIRTVIRQKAPKVNPASAKRMGPRQTSRAVAERNLDVLDALTSVTLLASATMAATSAIARFSGVDSDITVPFMVGAWAIGIPAFGVQRYLRSYRKDFVKAFAAKPAPVPVLTATVIRHGSDTSQLSLGRVSRQSSTWIERGGVFTRL